MSRPSDGLCHRWCSRFIFLSLLTWWKKKSQDRPDALAPAAFIVLAAARLEVHQVLRDDPALRHERVAKAARIRNHVLALSRSRVDPNAQRQLGRQRIDLAENHTVIPPN